MAAALGLGKLPAPDDSTVFANKLGLEKLFFRVAKTKVGKNIAAARGHFFRLAHFFLPCPQVLAIMTLGHL
jgi:hypothetical protein